MQQCTAIIRDNGAPRPACYRNRLGLAADSYPTSHKGSCNYSRCCARVQDGEEGGIAATGGHISEVEGRIGMGRAEYITATADTDEVGKVHRSFCYDTGTIGRETRIDGDDGRVGLVVAGTRLNIEVSIDRFGETSSRSDRC
jgi:hypothetical protein